MKHVILNPDSWYLVHPLVRGFGDVKAVVVPVQSALDPAASSMSFQPAVYVWSAELRRAQVLMECERGAWASPACVQLCKHRHLTFRSFLYCCLIMPHLTFSASAVKQNIDNQSEVIKF